MAEKHAVVPFKKELDFDDLPCALNPIQACDLKQILLMTPEDRRLDVACAFSGLTPVKAFTLAGLLDDDTPGGGSRNYNRWLKHENKLPLGAAFRVAKVFGVPCEILFQSKAWFT